MAKIDLKSWARVGAEQRLSQIDQERASILKAFPDLGGAASTAKKRRLKRRRMSAAAKEAVSARMKKYWAAKRKER